MPAGSSRRRATESSVKPACQRSCPTDMHVPRTGTAALCALWLCIGPQRAGADTYMIPPDYQIACLDLETGRKLWETAPGPLYVPRLSMAGGKLVAQDRDQGSQSIMDPMIPPESLGERYLLDPGDGRLVRRVSVRDPLEPERAPLAPLQSRTDSRGRVFEFNPGGTHDLQTVEQGRGRFHLKLEGWIHDLNVIGNLALFNFASESGQGGGEAYAYDLERRALAWEFDASRALPGLPDRIYTAIAADDKQVYISVDQTILALDIATGKQLWMTKLPRQTIRRYDSAWTTVGRHEDKISVVVYEDLFLLDARSGRLIWSFDAGPFAKPWPLVHDGKVYVGTRKGAVQQMSASFGFSGEDKIVSALKITRTGNRYQITPISRREIPPGEAVWWSLRPPPASGKRAPRIVLRLAEEDGDDQRTIDLTVPLARAPVTYVKFTDGSAKLH
jgi:outer membrane protein assembly factor BamB